MKVSFDVSSFCSTPDYIGRTEAAVLFGKPLRVPSFDIDNTRRHYDEDGMQFNVHFSSLVYQIY